MALYVNTNISSINAQRKLTNAVNNLNTSYQRLSSGLRINSARDDAAGLQISDRLTAQINGLHQGNRNASDGIALAQTIEGALEESTNMLQRIRTLAVQAANGTNTDSDRKAIQEEVTQLSKEIFRIAEKTTYAGALILNGTENTPAGAVSLVPKDDGIIDFQVGPNSGDTIGLNLDTAFKLSSMYEKQTGKQVMHVPPEGEYKDLDKGSAALPDGVQTKPEKDKPETWWKGAKEVSAHKPDDIPFSGLVVTASFDFKTITNPVVGKFTSARWSVSSAELAQATLGSIDEIIGFIDSKRAEFGAVQNRMEATIRNQSNIAENEADARSRIRDTDFAAETANMTQLNIIQQASQTILAQANQRPQIALQLLGR